MALIEYGIQLTSNATSAGPDYNVFYSTNCTDYTFAGVVTLEDTGSVDNIDIEETSTCIRLVSRGECQNGVVSGSSPSTDSYNTYRLTLTQKNGAGPEYIVSQNTGSLFSYLDTIELPTQGSTAVVNPADSATALRVRSNGMCTNSQNIIISSSVTPTPTPTPSPTPGPTATPTPTPSPTPTPAPNCNFLQIVFYDSISPTNVCCNATDIEIVYGDGTQLSNSTTLYSNNICTQLAPSGYYTQGVQDYYYWSGATLTGPTTCPACP